MKINWPEQGKYIVAVSGGVDSMCLLDILAKHDGYELIVAHVDHGTRSDSSQDAELVRELAEKNKFNFVITLLSPDKNASEEGLRQARYDFLFAQMREQNAKAILTAHHADDVLETSIMNVRRGTDRYGAAGGMNREGIIRPLLNVRKSELLEYADANQLAWHEDSTNKSLAYTRNKIRHEVIPGIDVQPYRKYLEELPGLNKNIDAELKGLVSVKNKRVELRRADLNKLGVRELEVLLAYAIRQIEPTLELSQPRIARLARHSMLNATKSSFSYEGAAGIIIEIQ